DGGSRRCGRLRRTARFLPRHPGLTRRLRAARLGCAWTPTMTVSRGSPSPRPEIFLTAALSPSYMSSGEEHRDRESGDAGWRGPGSDRRYVDLAPNGGYAALRLGTMIVVLIFAVSAVAAPPGGHRPLPPRVSSQAPGIHPFGKGRHSWWGIQMYDATLWIVGPQWSAADPHA